MGPNVADDAEICDFGVLGDFVPVDDKKVLVPCMSPIPWKSFTISFDMHFTHLIFSGPLMSCRYSWSFHILGPVTALALPGCNVRFPFTWLMTAQSSPAGRTSGAGLLSLAGGVLIVATWFDMMSCNWRCLARVLYRCCFCTLWVSDDF